MCGRFVTITHLNGSFDTFSMLIFDKSGLLQTNLVNKLVYSFSMCAGII